MGENGSDVYVYAANDSVECSMCGLSENDHHTWGIASFPTRSEAIAHLRAHQAAGDFVPEYAIHRLELEIEHDSNDARTNPWKSPAFKAAWNQWCNENDPWEESAEAE